MKWILASDKFPEKFGKYYVRSHCFKGMLNFEETPQGPAWVKYNSNGSCSEYCTKCSIFYWFDEDGK